MNTKISTIDDKIKKILYEDLDTNTDNLETSLNYNSNFQEIFSNSNKSSNKLFKNYLNI